MTFSIAEVFLLIWAIGMTVAYSHLRKQFNFFRDLTGEMYSRIARGKVKVTETDAGFEFRDV